MAEELSNQTGELEGGTYEIIRHRLATQASELRDRLRSLNAARQEVFGAIPTALVATDRVTTANNCLPQDMVAVGANRFIFGFNVHIGLKSETSLDDVFAAYECRDHVFSSLPLDIIGDPAFLNDFKQLYKYYRETVFAKFSIIGPHLFMVFRVGRAVTDVKTFKWLLHDGKLEYLGNRSDHEFVFPAQHEFDWIRTHRDLHRKGRHPHISIQDRLFVEAIGGDLTIKVEDNTDTGTGIYAEPVEHKDQTLDDAEIFYAAIDSLILLRIRPYQEAKFRHFVFNEKLKEVHRIDAMEDSCVLLPDGHGIIFSNGYYLQLGERKIFPTSFPHMLFERRVASPNGEDFLYVFYSPESGSYILMSYNVIEQKVDSPIVCSGYSIFANGELAYFKAEDEPQKHHAIQIWQTPYLDANLALPEKKESFLFKIGNPSIVRCMAECHEILALLQKDDSYSGLYVDLVKRTGALIDGYFWLGNTEAFELKAALEQIRNSAHAALNEFQKVIRLKRHTQQEVERVSKRTVELLESIHYDDFSQIDHFVQRLSALRGVRGELISLKDLRYVDLAMVESLENQVAAQLEELSRKCVDFLLKPQALEPYRARVQKHEAAIPSLAKVVEAKALGEQMQTTSADLDLLIEIVSNLKIEDATLATRIVDDISGIYAPLNQAKAALKKKRQALQTSEGEAEFASQLRLLDQSAGNFIDISDTPDKCDEYVTKLTVQIEELESRFADFDEFQLQLAAKREDLYSAFESRKLALVEARNKRASALASAADRILKGIQHRLAQFDSINEINGYCAGDLMVDRIRQIVQQLTELNDSVKAGDIQTRLKTAREEAVRQLKDRQELFVDGRTIIQFGRHKFAVNTQPLELSTVRRDGQMLFHLAGTNFFEEIEDPEFLLTRPLWDQELVSESAGVYRAEFLAYQAFLSLQQPGASPALEQFSQDAIGAQRAFVQSFMSGRFSEGYVKGVHDEDALCILRELCRIHAVAGLLKYSSETRVCASLFWMQAQHEAPLLARTFEGLHARRQLFPNGAPPEMLLHDIEQSIRAFNAATSLFPESLAPIAGRFLFQTLTTTSDFPISPEGAKLAEAFRAFLRQRDFSKKFDSSLAALELDLKGSFELVRDWLRGYITASSAEASAPFADEAAVLLLGQARASAPHAKPHVLRVSTETVIPGMKGAHAVVENGQYALRYSAFIEKLERYVSGTAPLFQKFQHLKSAITEQKRAQLRIDEFRPRVLTSFVRNRLIDSVYLPLVGDNLAKQLGVAGEQTRTDRMGMLLLISPPGYGKTTLMEYIANRLGVVFMKINGPALGHDITSLDPAEARNASAREEIHKLNLALEMGDNVMLYVDDIQHCNPEFLQKFISLCDAQRRIEGVYQGRPKTYDLRGKKIAVVMAGNPYTESGHRFQIPDMLSNRADTYNLGDIIAGSEEAFKLSYLENALTSNPILNKLGSRSQKDVYSIVKIAETGAREGIDFEGSYSVEEITELAGVMSKLIRIRDIVLRVNQEYIRSAGQTDAYRTEPPFKLQGSYRNMNRLAEKVVPIMNDAELDALIMDHYQNEAQTLTTSAEANLLKFKEIRGILTPSERARWDEIKLAFKRNLLLQGADDKDPVGRILSQLMTFSAGLDSIRATLEKGLQTRDTTDTPAQPLPLELSAESTERISAITGSLDSIRTALEKRLATVEPSSVPQPVAELGAALDKIQELLKAYLEQQQRQATFRLIDPSNQADYQITSVSQAALEKIWALVEADRAAKQQQP